MVDFGCFPDGARSGGTFSYIEISLAVGLLLAGEAVDFVLTGCSSGQGMMLACNSIPGVLCGYAPSPMDAFLFAQINCGNALSLPLGEEYTYSGEENCRRTVEALFSQPFGQGYPQSEAQRKLQDTELLKSIRAQSQVGFIELLDSLDRTLTDKLLQKRDVVEFVLSRGKSREVLEWIERRGRGDLPL